VADGEESLWVERLLGEAIEDSAHRPAFFKALLGATVWILGSVHPEPIGGVVAPGSTLDVLNLEDDDGSLLPFYTSESAVQATLDTAPALATRTVALLAQTFFDMTRGARLICNPHNDYSWYFDASDIEELLDEGR
jgi:type III secretion system (T3SS) SseB-like protein